MKISSIEHKIFTAFCCALLVMAIFLWVTYHNMELTIEESSNLNSSYKILRSVENVLTKSEEMEIGYNGYILTNNAHYLRYFQNAVIQNRKNVKVLLINSRMTSEARTDALTLNYLITEQIAFAKSAIRLKLMNGDRAALQFLDNTFAISRLDSILQTVNRIEGRERIVLTEENEKKAQRSHHTLILFLMLGSVMFIILLLSYLRIHNDSKSNQAASERITYLANLIEQTSDAIISIDKNSNIKSWNKGAEKMYGYSKQEAIGKTTVELLRSTVNLSKLDYFISHAEIGDYWEVEVSHTRKDETQIFVSSSITPFRNTDGSIDFVGVNKDITAQKKLEENLLKFNDELAQQVAEKTREIENIFERITEGFVAIDNDLKYTYVNKRATELLNRSREEMIGKKVVEVFPTVTNTPLYPASLEAMKTQMPVQVEYFSELLQKWIRNNIYPSAEGLSVFFRDVTEERQYHHDLIKSEEKYRLLIEEASDAILISDQKGNYVDVNQSACNLLGYSREEFLLLNSRDILLYAEDATILPSRYEELKSGKSFISERKLKRKDGTSVDVETNGKMLPDGRFIGFVRNISRRKKAEEELRISEQKYKLLFNKNPVPMWMTSLPGNQFIDVNEAAVKHYGYSRDEFLSMSGKDIRPPEEVERYLKYGEVRMEEIYYAGVWQHKKKDGTLINVEIIAQDIFYEGRMVRLVLANDVTEKLLAEEALKKSHEDLRVLASHQQKVREEERTKISREIHDELGQQLTAINLLMSPLHKKLTSNSNLSEQSKEIMALIDESLKTLKRISSDLRPVILDNIGLIAAIEWHCNEFHKRTGINCIFNSEFSELNLSKDLAIGIYRIYQEGLTNAARHSEAKNITTVIRKTDDHIVIEMNDDGKGFDLSSVKNKKTLGIIGMKERAIMLGGTFDINSGLNKGTTITVSIPLTMAEAVS